MRSDAERVLREMNEATADAKRLTAERLPELETLAASLDQASAQATMMQQTLDDAMRSQQDAAQRATQASQTLARQREDLAAIAEAGRYHVEQCRAAESTLRETLEQAASRTQELGRAAAAVREQAESMVALARDAAELVVKSRAQVGTDGPGAHA